VLNWFFVLERQQKAAFTTHFTSIMIRLYFVHWEWIASCKVVADMIAEVTRKGKLFQRQSKLLHFDEIFITE